LTLVTVSLGDIYLRSAKVAFY